MNSKYTLYDVFKNKTYITEHQMLCLYRLFRIDDESDRKEFNFAINNQKNSGNNFYKENYKEVIFDNRWNTVFFRNKSFANKQMNYILKMSILNNAGFRNLNEKF